MNLVTLIGNITRDLNLSYVGNDDIPTVRFTVAVNRKFKNKEGNYDADFISCVAWRKTAEFICNYFSKGKPICITGSIQTSTSDGPDGKKYYTDVVVNDVEFVGGKGSSNNTSNDDDLFGNEASDFKPYEDDGLPF